MSTTFTTAPLLVPVAPAEGATGRDKVAGPVVPLGKADHLLATRRPFRTGFRRNEWTGFADHSVTATLYRVATPATALMAPGTVLVAGSGVLSWGSAPAEVREAFRAELAAALDVWTPDLELQLYMVQSYDTPIAWGFHYVIPGTAYRPEIVSTPDDWECAGVTMHSQRYAAAALLSVPDVRYSQTTTQHQGACLGARIYRHRPADPVSAADYHGPDTVRLSIGRRTDAGDPGAVRAGRGLSPYGARVGW